MKLIVISGISGAGKSVAMHSLEDLDYYCVDNLPLDLLPALVTRLQRNIGYEDMHAAVAIDARNSGADFDRFSDIIDELTATGVTCQVVFLEADNNVLIHRFSETRRKHPLTDDSLSLAEALDQERRLLEAVRTKADLCLDTSSTHLHQLRDIIRRKVDTRPQAGLTLLFQSFGFKFGVPADADMVFDVRCLPNPYWDPTLRGFSGLDQPVQAFLGAQPPVQQMLASLIDFLGNWAPAFEAENRNYLTIAIGCTGGHHRSVFIAERLGAYFQVTREQVMVRHREIKP